MPGALPPQWLASAFCRTAEAIGATAPKEARQETAERLIERWQAEGRWHHNLNHLIDVLQRVDTLAPEMHHPEAVRMAAWYHGAIFDTSLITEYRRAAGEDKEASAQLAREELTALGVPARTVEEIAQLICSLRGHAPARDGIDCQALSDADLGSLAAEPQKYRTYRDNVRREFAHIDLLDYIDARMCLIQKLLDRPSLFATPLAAQWEDAARENLQAELHRLTDERGRVAAERASAADTADDGAASSTDEPIAAASLTDAPLAVAAGKAPLGPGSEEVRSIGESLEPTAAEPTVPPVQRAPREHEEPAAVVIGLPLDARKAPTAPALNVSAMERDPDNAQSLPVRNAPVRRVERNRDPDSVKTMRRSGAE